MTMKRKVKFVLAPLLVLCLGLSGMVYSPAISVFAPPPEVQGFSFSVADGSPLIASGVHPADILGSGGVPLIACENLGLLCIDPSSGAYDDIKALSFGWDTIPMGLPPLQFSVDASSQGMASTAVRAEASCSPSEPQADAFEASLDGTNAQDLDGDGLACGSNNGYGLGLMEGTVTDDMDALERDPCLFVDLDCNGIPENPIYLTLAPGSPSLDMVGATPTDILMTGAEYVPIVWAEGITDLGLTQGDMIDAICIRDNDNGRYDLEDEVLFSLAPGSPTLSALSASPSAILRPGLSLPILAEGLLGLEPTDNLDALVCSRAFPSVAVYLPLVMKDHQR
jgi:hypothetical protein